MPLIISGTKHRRLVVVAIINASNNFAFDCKKFYETKLLSEVGLNGDVPNENYSQLPITKEETINAIIITKIFQ